MYFILILGLIGCFTSSYVCGLCNKDDKTTKFIATTLCILMFSLNALLLFSWTKTIRQHTIENIVFEKYDLVQHVKIDTTYTIKLN